MAHHIASAIQVLLPVGDMGAQGGLLFKGELPRRRDHLSLRCQHAVPGKQELQPGEKVPAAGILGQEVQQLTGPRVI